ncbi:MAG: hypothetical protein WBB55_01790 [Anaerolineales bacterium]
MKQLSRILIIVLFLITSLGVVPGLASPDIPPSPIYLPFVSFIGGGSISISGTALDTDAYPIANVTIRDNYGFSAVTDKNGEYTLNTRKGENLLTAQNPGFTFEPEELSLNPSGDLSGQDFHGVVACGDIMVNGTVTAGDGGWDFPAKDPAYATAHTDSTIFRSPPTSGRTGIPVGKANADVHSNVISQKYHIPSDANHVLLSIHLYPQSTDLSDSDRQYVKILDSNDNLLQVLWNGLKNDAIPWDTYFEWEINSYVGQTIKIEVGTYNDGVGGVSRMYFDDVQLLICKQEVTPPACNKVINSDFESGYTGWTIPSGQVAPPVLSDVHAKSGTHSMKTGNTYTESFSEFYQDVDIPAGAANATLKFHVYSKSEEVAAAAPDINLLPSMPQEGDSWNSILAPKTDVQYAYVMDTSNNVLKKLMWWPNSNTNSWTYLEFDLSEYKDKTVRILFGTYNDGNDGKSTMWVDTVYLLACTASSVCYEALSNRSFENNTAWIVPATEYSAGYSTSQAHTGFRSMRAGIYITSHNKYSYSDFRQKVTIPSSATKAELKVWIWPKSTEPNAVPLAALLDPSLLIPQNVNGKLQMSPDAGDVQYILVLDKYGNWNGEWLWWKNNPTRDDRSWNSHVFDLTPWKGKTIYLQFGVYNNGSDGATSMFVDDASVTICSP